ncbi:MAG: thiamine pyrophosphate-dependent enzyme [Planctomycetota bacterium]|nr:thiamine pyrophosphate-dependent enzyme [Planctomycetota bacterium]
MAASTTPKTPKTKTAKPKAPAPRGKQRARPRTGSLFKQALDISQQEAATLLRTLYRIRRFGEKASAAGSGGEGSPPQPGATLVPRAPWGHEAVLAGACAALRRDDCVFSASCAQAASLARGGTLEAAFAAAGQDQPAGVVRGDLPMAVGAGLACKCNRKGQVALCFLDAAAASTGTFHEALHLAVLWHVPVVFVCANDLPAARSSAKGAPKPAPLHVRAGGYGLESTSCDGTHVLEVRATVAAACEHARSGKGPVFIAAVTPRGPDGRGPEEAEQWQAKDPLVQFRVVLEEAEAISPAQADAIEEEVAVEVEAAAKAAATRGPPEDGARV